MPESQRSNLLDILEQEMVRDPGHWHKYYTGSEQEQALKRLHSRSDRIRYYWRLPRVHLAVQRLMTNLEGQAIPPELISKEEGSGSEALGLQRAARTPAPVILSRIADQLLPYFRACNGAA